MTFSNINPMPYIKCRLVLCMRDHCYSTPTVSSTTNKVIIFVLVKIVTNQKDEAICILREDTNGMIQHVIQIELMYIR